MIKVAIVHKAWNAALDYSAEFQQSYYGERFNHFSSISCCSYRPGTSIRIKLNSGNVNIDNICIIIYSTSNSIRKLLLQHVNMKTEIFAFAGHKNANRNRKKITTIIILITDNEAPRKMSTFRKIHTPAIHLWPLRFMSSTPSEVRGQRLRGGSPLEAVPFYDGDHQLPRDWSPPSCPRSFPLRQISVASINLNVKRAHQRRVKHLISHDKPA